MGHADWRLASISDAKAALTSYANANDPRKVIGRSRGDPVAI